jgi:hypothetical protein
MREVFPFLTDSRPRQLGSVLGTDSKDRLVDSFINLFSRNSGISGLGLCHRPLSTRHRAESNTNFDNSPLRIEPPNFMMSAEFLLQRLANFNIAPQHLC